MVRLRIETLLPTASGVPTGTARGIAVAVGALSGSAAILAWQSHPALAPVRGEDVVPALAAVALALAALAVGIGLRLRHPPASRGGTVPLAALGDLVLWHDRGGDVVGASPASAALLGAAPRSLLGGGFLARVHVCDRPVYLKAVSDAANGSGAVTVTFRLHVRDEASADGREAGRPADVIRAEMRCQRIAAEDGAARHEAGQVIAFVRDVSDASRHAAELEAARHEAERANEMKGRFLATVTHELRTPLNAIIGFSELLSADHPYVITEERRKEYAQIIRSSGHHLLEIVNTLLDMSKIESGNFAFEPEPFPLAELAASSCDLIQLKADEGRVTLERRFDAALPEIVADRRACRQILINLVSNAVKFTPAGGRVTVSLSAAGDGMTLCVADTGIGIPAVDLPRLGDPFFQSGDVHRRNHEGTGLGLSVVRGLVGLHRGRMALESGTGAGTTVTVTLPLRHEASAVRLTPAIVQTRPRVAVPHPERMSA